MADFVSKAFAPRMLTASATLAAYREGFFPMGCGDGMMRWFSPNPRGVIPLDKWRAPHGFRRVFHRLNFEAAVDRAFGDVMAGCMDREETWMGPDIVRVYSQLHAAGAAHSVETWADGRLVGGLYGVRIGGVFFGESMFSRVSEASKFALVVLMEILRANGFGLLDVQWVTPHLAGFGAVEISRAVYLRMLRRNISRSCPFPAPGVVPSAAIALRHRQTG